MNTFYAHPQLSEVTMQDSFWTPYVEGIRDIMIPYCFEKFQEKGYLQNLQSVASQDGAKHIGPPFSDGLLLETMTGAVGQDFTHYYYDNPLVNDGTKNRWDWHACPCCPPMLSKVYSSLPTFIYSYNANEICVNMYIGSTLRTSSFSIGQSDKKFRITLNEGTKKVCFRIPQYAKDFQLQAGDENLPFDTENGYAVVMLQEGTTEITVSFGWKLAEICINPKVQDNKGKVCVMHGPYLMCAEGIDNHLDVNFTIAENPQYKMNKDQIQLLAADGREAVLIPYYKRNNRVGDDPKASAMAVWFAKENMKSLSEVEAITGPHLYGYYHLY